MGNIFLKGNILSPVFSNVLYRALTFVSKFDITVNDRETSFSLKKKKT